MFPSPHRALPCAIDVALSELFALNLMALPVRDEMSVANRMLVDVDKSRRDGMLVANRMLVDVGKSRRDGMLVEDDMLVNVGKSTDMSSLRDFCWATH
jgi:hypothetical protein